MEPSRRSPRRGQLRSADRECAEDEPSVSPFGKYRAPVFGHLRRAALSTERDIHDRCFADHLTSLILRDLLNREACVADFQETCAHVEIVARQRWAAV